jgi:hypothetical protein
MSSNLTASKLNDADCKKGQVTQQLPIPYAMSKDGLLLNSARDTIKLKIPKGEFKQALLGDRVQGEEYIKHLTFFFHHLEKKGAEGD